MAIAFGGAINTVDGGYGTSATQAFDAGSGSGRFLVVGVRTDGSVSTVTSVTYGGVAMTYVDSVLVEGTTTRKLFAYILPAPATGSNNIVVTTNNATEIYIAPTWYSGAKNTTTLVHATKNNGGDNNFQTQSLTPGSDNNWVVMIAGDDDTGGNLSAGAGTTVRTGTGAGGTYAFLCSLSDSNAAITPAALTALQVNNTSMGWWGSIMLAIEPAATSFLSPAYIMF